MSLASACTLRASQSRTRPPIRLNLRTPELHLHDRTASLALTFAASLTLELPTTAHLAQYLSDPPRLHLLRAAGLSLSLAARYDAAPLPPHVLDTWARCISSSEMWVQLQFTPALSIPSATTVHIALARTSHTEAMLPTMLPGDVAGVAHVNMRFEFGAVGERSSMPPAAVELMALTDTAVRSFWSDKVATVAPMVGRPGRLAAIESRAPVVEMIAEVLNRRGPGREGWEELKRGSLSGDGGNGEQQLVIQEDGVQQQQEREKEEKEDVTPQLWRVLLGNIKASAPLKPLRRSCSVDAVLPANADEDLMAAAPASDTAESDWERLFDATNTTDESAFEGLWSGEELGDEILLDETDKESGMLAGGDSEVEMLLKAEDEDDDEDDEMIMKAWDAEM